METTIDEFTTASDADAPGEPVTTKTGIDNFFEAMLADDERVDDLVTTGATLTETLHKMLLLAVGGLVVYGLAVGAIIQGYQAFGVIGANDTPPLAAMWMPPTIAGGFLCAIAICLPGFYFFTQLSGVDASFRLVTAQSLRVQARTSVILLGVMPFWVAWALTPFLDLEVTYFEPWVVMAAGIALPFIVGFTGLWSVYRSFRRLVERLPITHPRRGNFMLRLVLCWAAVMGCVTPVAMFRIAEFFFGIV